MSDQQQEVPEIGNPKIIREYKDANLLDIYQPTVEDLNEAKFYEKCGNSEIRRAITQIYRIRVGTQEYLLYNETLKGKDPIGNTHMHSALRGRLEMPVFSRRYDPETAKAEASSLEGKNTEYDIPFSKENLNKILAMDTERSNPGLVITDGPNKYAGFSLYEFSNRHFDDLMYRATMGVYPEQLKQLVEYKNIPQTRQQEPADSEKKQQPSLSEFRKGLLLKPKEDNTKDSSGKNKQQRAGGES